MDFQGWSRKNNVEYPEVVVLGFKIYVGRNTHNFVEFLGVKHHFVWDFQGWSKKSKNSSVFSKKYVSMSSTPPPPCSPPSCLIFFWHSPLWYWLNGEKHTCMRFKAPPLLPYFLYINIYIYILYIYIHIYIYIYI